MKRPDIPFNVSLLELTPAKLQGLKPVRVLDIYDGAGTNFHEDGLWSVSIFGRVGDERRNNRFSYIDMRVPVFHPVIFRALLSLKRLYGGIMSGQEYAVWNEEVKDFERSTAIEGKTGYHFFLSKWKQLEFEESSSIQRDFNIRLLKKFQAVALTDKMIVMPAGLRDAERDGTRTTVDEINNFYQQAISVSNTISDAAVKHNPEIINTARYRLQTNFNQLYDYIENMIQGKKKLLLGKWASRRIMNGTRNVITAMNTSVPYLGAPGGVNFNSTELGLYQMLKAALPLSIYHLRNGYLRRVFPEVGQPAMLVNKKTLKAEAVPLRAQYYDRWMTNEGLERVITAFGEEDMRHRVMEIEGRYLGLVYKGPDGTFKIIQDIDEIPEGRSKKDVTPLTFAELLYAATYRKINGLPTFVTRYPVTGIGSIYPSESVVRTTVTAEPRRELGDNWEPLDESFIAYQFPIRNEPFVNSLIPHTSKLKGLGADFDGDTSSANVTYSDEAIAEVKGFLKTRRAYVGTNGKFISSTNIDTVALVLFNMTGGGVGPRVGA